MSAATDMLRAKNAEIERLREELPECQMCATIHSSDGWYCAECAPDDYEVERLKMEIERLGKENTGLMAQVMIFQQSDTTLQSRLDAAVEQCHMILGWVEDDSTVEMQVEVILDKLIGGGR